MSERNKHRLVYLLLAITTLPFIFLVNQPDMWSLDLNNVKSISLYVSAVFGYIGISLLLWELILGTRSISGLYFENLTSKLRLHRLLGTYGITLALLHPFLIMYAYGESLLYIIWPNVKTAFETGVTYGRFAFMALVIVWVSSAILRSKIAYRPWKYIHYVSYPLIILALLHVPDIGSSYIASSIVRAIWYGMVVVAIVCFALRLRHVFGIGKVRYRVADIKQLTSNAWVLRLHAIERNLDIKKGQYIYVQQKLIGEEHPFTVLQSDHDNQELYIAYKEFGSFTKKLKHLSVNDVVYIDGPYGTFTSNITHSNKKQNIFIAGGIGITPFLSHVLFDKNQPFLFYANQTIDSAVFRAPLKKHLHSNYVDILSHQKTTVHDSNIEYGLISDTIVRKYISHPEECRFFICGPVGLIDMATIMLITLGVPKQHIHNEKFEF